ncbi:MAG: TolC family protein [Elusimicrobia bacterium]|nr:TolC family protein [Elusimicrobiota bacterium]
MSPMRAALLAGLLAALAAPARAGGVVLSLRDCLDRAVLRSPRAVAAGLETLQAASAARASADRLLPSLSVEGQYQQSGDQNIQAIDVNSASLHLAQDLSPLSPAWAAARQAQARAEAARWAGVSTRADVLWSVKTLYFSILRDQDVLAALDRMSSELKLLRDQVLPRYTVGQAPPFDLAKVRQSLDALDRSRDAARDSLETEKAALAFAVGLDSATWTPAPLKSLPPLPGEAASFDPASSPAARAAAARARAAELGLTAAERRRYPDVTGSFDYGWAGVDSPFKSSVNSPDNSLASPTVLGWNVAVAASLPLWNWGALSADIAGKRAGAAAARQRRRRSVQEASVSLLALRLAASSDRADYERQRDFLPTIRAAAEASVGRYRRGAVGILEVSDALDAWLGAMTAERTDYYAYLADLAGIERVMGKDSVRYE